jgi:NTE family protein
MSKVSTAKKALVLSGGGFAGGAWMLGLINGLRDRGVDLGDADLVVGTSAGARAATQVATGVVRDVMEMHRRSQLTQNETSVKMEDFVTASMRIIVETADRQGAARRIANMEPLGPGLVSEAERKRVIAPQLPVQTWPDRRLVITAVDAGSGGRVAFDAHSGAELLDAVTASGALPGMVEPIMINGRRYVDGGVHSLYNADLAAGHDVVTVISAMPLNDYFNGLLETETAVLAPATVHLIVVDEASLAAIGPDSLSSKTGRAAMDAGEAQAEHELQALATAWDGTN